MDYSLQNRNWKTGITSAPNGFLAIASIRFATNDNILYFSSPIKPTEYEAEADLQKFLDANNGISQNG